MKIATVDIDLAKNEFQVHAVDEHGKVALRKLLRRDQMTTFFVNLPPCLIDMEAWGSAHHWATAGVRPHGALDVATVRRAVCEEQQE